MHARLVVLAISHLDHVLLQHKYLLLHQLLVLVLAFLILSGADVGRQGVRGVCPRIVFVWFPLPAGVAVLGGPHNAIVVKRLRGVHATLKPARNVRGQGRRQARRLKDAGTALGHAWLKPD